MGQAKETHFFAENRRARFDYDIGETLQAGIELKGFEVKAVRAGRASLTGSYAVIRGGELWLLNASISPHQPGNTPADYKPDCSRRLLLRHTEIARLAGLLQQKSFTFIPLCLYAKGNLIKVSLGVGHSRYKTDKRELIKKREQLREMREDK